MAGSRMWRRICLAASILLLSSASGTWAQAGEADDADEASEAGKADGREPDKASAADEAALAPLALELAPLHGDAPPGAKVSEMMGGILVQAPDLVAMVEAVPMTRSKPLDADGFLAEIEMYAPQKVVRETLDDGWMVTFLNEGDAGTNYWVHVRRKIDGKLWKCTTTAATELQQHNAVAFCKSLRAAP